MSKILLCLGMHRSGTSLVANWLHACGLNMGDRLYGGDIYNKEGYFEDIDFINLHEEVFFSNKIPSGGLFNIGAIHLDYYHDKKMEYLLNFKSSLHEEWGWKDPRTCLFLDHYKLKIPNANYLIVYRDYQEVVDSLVRRQISGLSLWYNALSFKDRLLNYFSYKNQKKNAMSMLNIFLKAFITYNESILELVKTTDPSMFIIVNYKNLINNQDLIHLKLKGWGFNLKKTDYKTIFKEELIQKTPPNRHFDRDLCEIAEKISKSFTDLENKQNAGTI